MVRAPSNVAASSMTVLGCGFNGWRGQGLELGFSAVHDRPQGGRKSDRVLPLPVARA
jgi:hypothetical protein